MAPRQRPLLALVGPTAVGKTAASLVIAEHLDAEIISADSRQIYKELTVGTAKPSPEELACVPHHFIDELSIVDNFSAGTFATSANARIHEILQRGHIPIVVGGSTLYLQALIHGLSPVPPSDRNIRRTLEDRLRNEGRQALFAALKKVDPASARKLDSTKTHRVIRALEVHQQTGRPISAFQEQQANPPYRYDIRVLAMDRTKLYERINKRTDHMLMAGLVDEVRKLRQQGYAESLPSLRTIGYKEVLAFLDGRITEVEMVRLIKRNTRRYAKRQLTWFRRYPPDRWIHLDDTKSRKSLLRYAIASEKYPGT